MLSHVLRHCMKYHIHLLAVCHDGEAVAGFNVYLRVPESVTVSVEHSGRCFWEGYTVSFDLKISNHLYP